MTSACSKSLELDRAFADADRRAQRRAARLVAHVRAVGQIVGAELADEKLVEKRRFVAGAARRVEDGFVRRGEPVQFPCDQREGLVPRDRLVMRAAGRKPHGLGDPPLLAEPVVGLFGKFGDAVGAKEVVRDAVGVGFPGEGLRAVFAELGHAAAPADWTVRIGPAQLIQSIPPG